MIVEVRVLRDGELGVHDQFDAWIVNPLLLDKAAKREFGLVEADGGRFAETSRNYEANRGVRIAKRLKKDAHTRVCRNGSDALLDKRVNATQPFAHPYARPDGPFERQTTAVRM